MRIRVLGCSGGIGGRHQRTASLQVDHDILIDCGTGVTELSADELAWVDHVFLSHSHIDHVACLPLMVDTVGEVRPRPLTVHALAATEQILRAHLFNELLWPDFTRVPDLAQPWMRFAPLVVGQPVVVAGRRLTPLPANHAVPAVGFQIDSGRASLVYSGDTGPCAELWQAVNAIDNLKALIVETSFPNSERAIASASRHLCPSLLQEELRQLRLRPEVYITHLKPGRSASMMVEIEEAIGAFRPQMLQNNQEFEL